MMVKKCCVKKCSFKKKHKDKFSLHLFPTNNAELLKKWIDFLGCGGDWKPKKHSAICSAHFLPTDFEKHTNLPRLKPNVIPTIKLVEENDSKNLITIDLENIPSVDLTLEITGNLRKTCRLCGNEFKSDLGQIFEDGDAFASRIQKCFHLLVSRDDVLPLSICNYCKINLEKFEQFISKIEQSQKILIKRFCSMNEMENEISSNNEENNVNAIIIESEIIKKKNISTKPLETENDDEVIPSNANTNLDPNVIVNPPIINSRNLAANNQPASTSSNNNLTYKISSFTSTHKTSAVEDPPLKIPIKKELMTPCPDKEVKAAPSIKNIHKKIEILENIKIDPIQIGFKSLKPRQEENVINIQNVNPKPHIIKDKLISKINHKHKSKKVSSILLNSTNVCDCCKEKFISKWSLNNHIKYLCEKKRSNEFKMITKCNSCKKTYKANHKHLCKKKITLLKANVS